MPDLSTDRRGFLSALLGSAGALAVDARIAPDAEEQAALTRLDAWIALADQHEAIGGRHGELTYTPEYQVFLAAHPDAGLIGAQLFRDLLTAIRYAMKAKS